MKSDVVIYMYLACCPGEGSELEIWPEPRVLPLLGWKPAESEAMGWWRDAVKPSWDRGEGRLYLYRLPLVLIG